jgi:Leucine-rich repeat (LRR) protein
MGLQSLNLSSNQLSGPLPVVIGVLVGLESLDLSYNYFSGETPSSLSNLTILSWLNLSYNDLSGRYIGIEDFVGLLFLTIAQQMK